MRFHVLITAFLVCIAAAAFAQTDTTRFSFLNHVSFKNGKGIVVIKAIYQEIHRSGAESWFLKMSEKKKLRLHDYFLSCCGGAALTFTTGNSSQQYEAVIREGIAFDTNHSKPGDIIYLTCLVFKAEKEYNGDPFFVITNISAKNPLK